ncbi:PREDICTED: uncharacterized protein LOC105557894 [Vollenhovia emeryi]|uniref:uncharacterized protein LOC105557894 n=1 Tax=Vollenhovia emeryi TaxID=411798 RepID=UPI0005F53D7B|nr:PREDICTED: uncharacterized protein LOC105557894 [Vollenhovia emeryi]
MYTNAHKEMILINSLQISLNRVLLLLVGLWPYQQSKLVRIQWITFVGILTTCMLFQFTVFVTLKCTMGLIIDVLSSALFCLIITIKYILFGVNIKNIKYLLEELQHIYNELTDENEIIIIEKYGYYAKCYTITLTLLVTSGTFTFFLYNYWPDAYHIVFYTNETWSHRSLPYMTEYFMDKEKYFHVMLFHVTATFVVGGVSLIATGSILIVYLQHACGMFQIAWFSDLFTAKFRALAAAIMLVGVVCSSLNMFRMISFGANVVELLISIAFIGIQLVYALIGNYLAQEITDNNNNIFVVMYDVQWYVAPLQIQKMILFVLQRGAKVFTMNIAGIFIGSLEGAATVR